MVTAPAPARIIDKGLVSDPSSRMLRHSISASIGQISFWYPGPYRAVTHGDELLNYSARRFQGRNRI